MEVTLGTAIGLELFQGLEPTINRGVFLTQSVPLVVSKRCIHALHIGNKHQVHGAGALRLQPGGVRSGQRLLESLGDGTKLLTGLTLLPGVQTGGTEPETPGPEQQPLKLAQGKRFLSL